MDRNASDIFCLKDDEHPAASGQIFSVGGSPSFRIRRHQEKSTVFPTPPERKRFVNPYRNSKTSALAHAKASPSAPTLPMASMESHCMDEDGLLDAEEHVVSNPCSPRMLDTEDDAGMDMRELAATPSSMLQTSPISISAMSRNPLTGEGMDDRSGGPPRSGIRKVNQWTW